MIHGSPVLLTFLNVVKKPADQLRGTSACWGIAGKLLQEDHKKGLSETGKTLTVCGKIRGRTDYLPRKMLYQLCGMYMPFIPEVETSSQATISAQMTAPVQIVRVF